MPVLQLPVDVDSDVHPELHAMLASIVRSPARAERLRKLATDGLIWEQLRAQARSAPEPAAGFVTEIGPAGGTRPPPRGEIPVLTDVIDEAALRLQSGAAARPDAAVQLASGSDLHGPGWSHGGQGLERVTPPVVRSRGARPRLLKMREKGLFRNGPDD